MSTFVQQKYIDLFNDTARTEAFVKEVFDNGFAMLPDFLTPETKGAIDALLVDRAYGNKKNEALHGTVAGNLSVSDELMQILNSIHQTRCRLESREFIPLKVEKQSAGFPYKNATDGAKTKPTEFHYDAAYTNVLIPFILPSGNTEGHLIMYPSLKKRIKNPLLRKLFSRFLRDVPFARTLYPGTLVKYKLGGFHFFFGDISFHGVLPITHDERMVMTINSHW